MEIVTAHGSDFILQNIFFMKFPLQNFNLTKGKSLLV